MDGLVILAAGNGGGQWRSSTIDSREHSVRHVLHTRLCSENPHTLTHCNYSSLELHLYAELTDEETGVQMKESADSVWLQDDALNPSMSILYSE